MSKEYLMFIDERGCYSNSDGNNFSMVGVIFEHDYCTNLSNVDSELTDNLKRFKKQIVNTSGVNDIRFNNITEIENVFCNKESEIVDKTISILPKFLKDLKFSIVSTSIKQDSHRSKDLYELAVNNLIKRFYSFIINKKAKSGGVIVQSRYDEKDCSMPQKFFNIYNERKTNFYMYEDIDKKINKFMICEVYNKEYIDALEVSNMINNLLLSILGSEDEYNFNIEYDYMNRILNILKEKIYREEIDLLNDSTQKYIQNALDKYSIESEKLKYELSVKNRNIMERDKEIVELTEEINILKQQLQTAIINRKSESIIFDILSQVDVKINGIEKQVLVNVNN